MIRFSMSHPWAVYHRFRSGLMKRFVSHTVHADASVLERQLIRELDNRGF